MNKVIVYNYDFGHGGIADFIKYFFMLFMLQK